MKEYKLTGFQKLIYVIKNYLFYLMITIIGAAFLLEFVALQSLGEKIIIIAMLVIPLVIAVMRLLNKPANIKIDDQEIVITQGSLISHFKFNDYAVSTYTFTSYAYVFIPTFKTRELIVVNLKDGKDEHFKLYGMSSKMFNAITEDLDKIQK